MKAVYVSPEKLVFVLARCISAEQHYMLLKYIALEDFDALLELQLLAENLQKLYHVG